MPNGSRPVDLLSDSKGVYGIGIVYDDLIEEKRGCDKHLIFRPDVIANRPFPWKIGKHFFRPFLSIALC